MRAVLSAAIGAWLIAASSASAQTVLAEALRTHSVEGEALPALLPIVANEDLYFATGCPEAPQDPAVDGLVLFMASTYRDRELFYAFDSLDSLNAWLGGWEQQEPACWVAMRGRDFAAFEDRPGWPPYVVVNIETTIVVLTPSDIAALRDAVPARE